MFGQQNDIVITSAQRWYHDLYIIDTVGGVFAKRLSLAQFGKRGTLVAQIRPDVDGNGVVGASHGSPACSTFCTQRFGLLVQ